MVRAKAERWFNYTPDMRIRKFLKQIIIISTLFLLANASIAQSQDVNALHETARSFMRQAILKMHNSC